jgi:uncharacterized protein
MAHHLRLVRYRHGRERLVTMATHPDARDTGPDRAAVERLLGRPARGHFEVVVRHDDGSPLVIRNAPLLDDGTPMPTRWWLVGEPERTQVSRLEAAGGVAAAQAAVDGEELAAAHARYAAMRDAALPPGHEGPTPYGGVGGTRRGVKCLHAHYAWFLAGGDDPVGQWVHARLHPSDGTDTADAVHAEVADADGPHATGGPRPVPRGAEDVRPTPPSARARS